ncbi:MAG: arginine repressor [Armatimonadota bacterium]|nr:arginine repressor [Armatimonadota bacterium]MDW8155214.1 arginine repressor [Armatimonadota bacterium]
MNRAQREHLILEIVASQPVQTQEELVRALRERGLRVTQATVSRDVKRLGLVKVPEPQGGYRYAPPQGLREAVAPGARAKLQAAFREFVTGVDWGEGLVLVKTLAGRANAVAAAIDEARMPEVAGTVAGDDTILVVVRRAQDRDAVVRALGRLLE